VVVAQTWGEADVAREVRRARAWATTALARAVYLPACLVAALAGVLVGVGWMDGWGGADFTGSLGQLWIVVVGPASLAALGVILIAERVRPAQPRPLVARGHRHDLLYLALDAGLVVPLTTGLTLSFAAVVRRAVPFVVLPHLAAVPRTLVVLAVLVAMDGCNWFVHLANHRVRVLWRFHELHHSQEDLNALTVFRTHPFIHLSYLLALVPGLVLLANGALTTGVLVGYGAMVALAHSNTDLSFGPLGRVVVSPNYHRIHHRLDGAQDVNLGFALTVWDQLAARAVFPTRETVAIATGIPGRPLAVEQDGDRPRHLVVLARQLVGPFRPMPRPVELPSVRHEDREPVPQ
jgi:sterol desaturase/sphingolipid hydroxylase (fatty acid hydroxylase superfamily)